MRRILGLLALAATLPLAASPVQAALAVGARAPDFTTRGAKGGKIFKLQGLLEGKFADGGAANFRQMRAATQLLAHFMGQRANVCSGRAFDDETRHAAFDFLELILE